MALSASWRFVFLLLFLLFFPSSATTADLHDSFQDIRYHAIVEAPADEVWSAVTKQSTVARWLARRAYAWSPGPDRKFRITTLCDRPVIGTFTAVDESKRIDLAWPEPATTLTIAVTPLDEYLTMLTLVHAGWPTDADDNTKRLHADMTHYWRVAMIKLHRLFPNPLVDTTMHRPRPKPPSTSGDKPGFLGTDSLFIERNLIVNGDFGYHAPGKYDGVAFGWETNTARSTPDVHAIDTVTFHTRPRAQRLANPPDWTNFAVQQFTSHIEPLITPGKRYRLTGWVRAEGIRNPAGWYKLGLWFTDAAGKPIGDFHKNDQLTDDAGNAVLNHNWTRLTVEAVAPPNAARAVVILSGHWDDTGTVWYDDITLWPTEKPPTTRE